MFYLRITQLDKNILHSFFLFLNHFYYRYALWSLFNCELLFSLGKYFLWFVLFLNLVTVEKFHTSYIMVTLGVYILYT